MNGDRQRVGLWHEYNCQVFRAQCPLEAEKAKTSDVVPGQIEAWFLILLTRGTVYPSKSTIRPSYPRMTCHISRISHNGITEYYEENSLFLDQNSECRPESQVWSHSKHTRADPCSPSSSVLSKFKSSS